MGRSPTVLVVDDDEQVRTLYRSWLEEPYEVRTAVDGRAALAVVDDEVDVVLLDRRMPEQSGDAVLERLRDRGLRCRVAMVTAVDPGIDILDMGFDSYLVKPVDRETLVETVETLHSLREYDERLARAFRLASKKSALAASTPVEELRADEEYRALERELQRVRAGLVDALASMSDEGFDAAFRGLVDPTYPPAPSAGGD